MNKTLSKSAMFGLVALLLIATISLMNSISALDCTTSLTSTSNQYWTTNSDVTLNITYLGSVARITHKFGYYLNGSSTPITWLFNDNVAPSGSKYIINVAKNTKIGFVIDGGGTWYSEPRLNYDNFNHFSVTGPASNFNLNVEDLAYGGDRDFNDVMVNVKIASCAVCNTNLDCNDNNARTEDICINPGTTLSSCSHNNIRCLSNVDCGTDAFTGNTFCSGNGVFQNYNSFKCSNPGTNQSSCSNSVTAMLKTSCLQNQICNNAQCITTQCSNNIDDDMDGLMDAADPGCWDNINDPNTYNPLLNNESRAGVSCFTNAQCGRDGFVGDKSCQNGNVYQDYKTFTCSNPGKGSAVCSSSIVPKNVQTCSANTGCQNGQCVSFTCNSNADCNDNDLYTIDECNNPGTLQSNCSHTKINCVNDNDCGITGFFGIEFCSTNDVFKNYKTSRCLNPGTKQSNCQVNTVPTFLVDCGENSCDSFGPNYCKVDGNVYHQRVCNDKGCNSGACFSTFRSDENLVQSCQRGCQSGQCKPECTTNADCSNGKVCQNNACVQVRCNTNTDCNDNNDLTLDSCNNPGTGASSCSYTNITCSSDANCDDHNTATQDMCMNPGTAQSVCHHMPISCTSNTQCGQNGFSNLKFCSNGSVFDKYVTYTCNNPGTGNSACSSSSEDRQVSSCTAGCQDGQCINAECNVDDDCSRDRTSSSYCINNSVYQDLHDYSCTNSKCVENVSPRLVENCDYVCSVGKCKSKTSGTIGNDDSRDDTANIESTPLVILNNVDHNKVFGSISEGINETSIKLGSNSAFVDNSYNYIWLFVIGLIILLIVILIVVLVLLNRK